MEAVNVFIDNCVIQEQVEITIISFIIILLTWKAFA